MVCSAHHRPGGRHFGHRLLQTTAQGHEARPGQQERVFTGFFTQSTTTFETVDNCQKSFALSFVKKPVLEYFRTICGGLRTE